MKIRILAPALCALAVLGCDDTVAPNDIDLGSARDRAVLGDPTDASVLAPELDAQPDIPLLEPEPDPDEPEPDPGPEPEPMEPEPTGPCTSGETRLCVESCGVASCVDGAFGPCQAVAELCNGHDDNCNGSVDEGYAGLGVGCVVDQNGCSSQGTRVCGADQRSVICDAPAMMPQPEQCDGDDDDCDGNVDEDFPGRVCCADDLQCGPGETCEAGECTGGVGPGPNPNPGQCVTDFDCFFQFCVQGICRDPCFSDLDCAVGEVCDIGACVPGGGPECVVDNDCFGFETCENGVCAPPMAPPCVADAECPGAQTCQNGVCALPPGGSSCDGAIAIDGFGVFRGSNVGAFDTLDGGCGRADDGPEQVFAFTSEINARVSMTTDGSNFDTVLSVRTACAANGPELGCDDDGGEGNTSALDFDATAGVTYFVVVEGYADEDVGDIVLNVAGVEICVVDADCPDGRACDDGACVVPPCVADADCPEGEVCRVGVCQPPPPPLCDGGIVMDDFGDYVGSNVGAADRVDGSCRGAAATGEQVFTFRLDAAADVVLDTSGADFDTVMSVWTDCDDRDLFCDDDGGVDTASRIAFAAQAGVQYYVVVEGYGAGDVGNIPLRFRGPGQGCGEGCEGACTNAVCVPPIPDACAGATPADIAPGAWQGDTFGLPDNHVSECGGGGSPDDVLLIGFPNDTRVTASTDGSDFDTVLYVLEECGAEIACNDDVAFLVYDSEVSFLAEGGVGYYIVVDGYDGDSGIFQLTVDVN